MAESSEISKDVSDILPSADNCIYTKCYCEENVWMLCNHVKKNSPDVINRCYCCFISNNDKTIPLWCQKASNREDKMVCWDYHVIFILANCDKDSMVYDLDTTLSFPCDFKTYAGSGIRPNSTLQPQFHRKFRVIKADEYLSTFASDRSHMIGEDGSWMSPPPSYPCIQTEDTKNNITEFISMDPNFKHGKVLSFEEFVRYFYQYKKD